MDPFDPSCLSIIYHGLHPSAVNWGKRLGNRAQSRPTASLAIGNARGNALDQAVHRVASTGYSPFTEMTSIASNLPLLMFAPPTITKASRENGSMR